MNNSFPRLIDGVCATLRSEVLNRISDEYARSQVYGVINLLNTFKARADWSAGFLLQQIEAQRVALAVVAEVFGGLAASTPTPALPALAKPQATPIADLLALRDEGNRALSAAGAWLDLQGGALAAAGLSLPGRSPRARPHPPRRQALQHVPLRTGSGP